MIDLDYAIADALAALEQERWAFWLASTVGGTGLFALLMAGSAALLVLLLLLLAIARDPAGAERGGTAPA